jgi:hypothetical protein
MKTTNISTNQSHEERAAKLDLVMPSEDIGASRSSAQGTPIECGEVSVPKSPKDPVPTVADFPAPPEDLILEFKVRVWGRDREVFKQHRIVSIWKGAVPSFTYRSLAQNDIVAQLEHMLQTINVKMRQYTEEVEPPMALGPGRPIKLPDGFFPVSVLPADFCE